MEALLIIVALMLFAFLGLGVYVTAKVVKAAKAGVDRTITQARRTVEDTTLRARSIGQAGVGGSLAQLRLDLRNSMRATQEALFQGVEKDASLRETIGLFERLSAHGHELDAELKRMESDPDKARIAERLPELRERTERITKAADSLRWAARDRARSFASDELDLLTSEIEMESGALRDWAAKERADGLDGLDPVDGAGAAGAGSGAGSGGTAGRPGGAGAGGAAGPKSLGPATQQWETSYPWEKTARPEASS
ncbi:hypothetical protein LG634_08020 [Streptomyces bambusae]|uniref:hypothetical protein n=1 Tax=Streptomyces bambusae TaxID=1550616 RepID=UPI001CFEB561|nr:hypothetical protein [Streptomyces bambusae]MCB5164778.1 hypothetical protein [Streptomyces bambusae]